MHLMKRFDPNSDALLASRQAVLSKKKPMLREQPEAQLLQIAWV
jgi:hypothetical protein